MKIFFRTIHLYLSLAAGIVILIVCLTGAILVFEKELQEMTSPDRYYAEPTGQRLSADILLEKVKAQYPDAKVTTYKAYTDPNRTVEINITEKDKSSKDESDKASKGAKEVKGEGKGGEGVRKIAFVNPYSGSLVELYSYRETFFYKVFALHRWLLGKNDGPGKYIVGISTLIFLFILITGVILWWPKTRKILTQRLKIKWDGSWKRLNHDFHIVLGFYTAIFLFIFAFTGLAWSFQWFNKGIYTVTRSEMAPPAEPPVSAYSETAKPLNVGAVLSKASSDIKSVLYYNISLPKDSTGVFAVTVLPETAPEMASNTYYLDQYSGQVIGALMFSDKNLGQRVRSTFKPVHTGSIFGVYSKVIAFITCLLGATFPVTGTIMWIARLNKKRRKEKSSIRAISEQPV
ncbi:PepSY domain-containing protein [Flavihumibacter sp. R14]|nr:PepSY domain-containing protein [Flavihumibacter soli]